jgi:cysteinyl-tRNA synthetase
MAGKYLGDAFDIHGGGIDLRFPHHENEMAQSRAAGRPFASYWMHNAFVTMAGEKMSKSLGNIASVSEVTRRHPARAVRLYLAGPHYRSTIELSEASLGEADAQLARIDSFLDRARHLLTDAVPPAPVPEAFAAALNDDLGTPAALAVLFATIREGNAALEAGQVGAVRAALAATIAMLDVLGLNPEAPEWAGAASASDDLAPVVDALVGALLAQRQEARSRRDWAAADAIRDALTSAGLKIEDTRDGARWSLERG